MSKTTKAHLALLLANIIYGLNFSIAKDIMPAYIKPYGFILVRVITAIVIFTVLDFFNKQKIKISLKDFNIIFWCSIFGVALNQTLFFKGLSITTPINGAILMLGTPILVMLFSFLWLGEALSKYKIIGLIFGLLGSLIILLLNKQFSLGSETFLGDVLIFLNAISYGFYMVMIAPLMKKYPPITILKWMFTFSIFFVFPISYQEFTEISWTSFSAEIWYKTIYVVIGTTIIAYFLNIYALKILNPSIVSIYLYSQPFIATIYAVSLKKDVLHTVKVIGGIFICLGVYLVSFKNEKV